MGLGISWLQTRPGPPLPPETSFCKASLSKALDTFSLRHQLPQCFRFLYAYFFFSDAMSTTFAGIAVLGIVELSLEFQTVLWGFILLTSTSIVSVIIVSKLVSADVVTIKTVLVAALCLYMVAPIYVLFGLKNTWEYPILCVCVGIAAGPFLAYTRAMFSLFIPEGREAPFFSLYQITDKGTAWLGPLL